MSTYDSREKFEKDVLEDFARRETSFVRGLWQGRPLLFFLQRSYLVLEIKYGLSFEK